MYAYSNPAREHDDYALPDVEVYYVNPETTFDEVGNYLPSGWYWHSCFPGCLPDGDPIGPFNSEQEALNDARDLF